jgi:hypothetical protein
MFTDGLHTTPRAHGTPRIEYPFLSKGNRDAYVVIQPVAVRAGGYVKPTLAQQWAWGALPAGADTTQTHYLVHPTQPVASNGWIEWEEIYSPEWADVVYLDYTTYNKPSLLGLTYNSITPTASGTNGGEVVGGSLNTATASKTAVGTSLSANSSVTGGTFTLTVDGETTDPIEWDADDADIISALEALDGVAADSVYLKERNNPAKLYDLTGDLDWTYDPGGANEQRSYNVELWLVETAYGTRMELRVQLTAGTTNISYDRIQVMEAGTNNIINGWTPGGASNFEIAPTGSWQTIWVDLPSSSLTFDVRAWHYDTETARESSLTVDLNQVGSDNSFTFSFKPEKATEARPTITADGSSLIPSGAVVDVNQSTAAQQLVQYLQVNLITGEPYTITIDGDDATFDAFEETRTTLETGLNALSSVTTMGGLWVVPYGDATEANCHKFLLIPKNLSTDAYDGSDDRIDWLIDNTSIANDNGGSGFVLDSQQYWGNEEIEIVLRSTQVFITATSHGLSTGDDIWIEKSGTVYGKWAVTVEDANTLIVYNPTAALQAIINAGTIDVYKDEMKFADTAHGKSTGTTIYFYTTNNIYITHDTITSIDADNFKITGLNQEEYEASYAKYSTAGDYFPGNKRMRARYTLKSYQPGVTTGVTTAEDVPLPVADTKAFNVLAAIVDQTATLIVEAGELRYQYANMILVTQIEIFIDDLLE